MKKRRWIWLPLLLAATAVLATVTLPIACDSVVGNRSFKVTGRVVDELGQPIEGVSINVQVSRYRRFPPPSPWDDNLVSWSDRATTDDEGRFSFRARGRSLLIVDIMRQAYLLPRKGPPGQYSFHGTAPASPPPVTISMWKRRGSFRLAQRATRWTASPGGRIAITLDDGASRGVSPDLHVSFEELDGRWTITIEPVDGGIQDATDPFLFFAPLDGYQAKRSYIVDAARSWAGPLYIRCHNKQIHAVATASLLGTDSKQADFYLNYRANRSGQPNLEPDRLAPFDP